MRNEKYTPIDPRLLPHGQAFGDYFSHGPYIHPSLQQSNPPGRLPCPVIIPQRRPGDKSRRWVRAYAPVLAECDIDQYTFLNFIDAFNDSCKVSSSLTKVELFTNPYQIVVTLPGRRKCCRARSRHCARHHTKISIHGRSHRCQISKDYSNREDVSFGGVFGTISYFKYILFLSLCADQSFYIGLPPSSPAPTTSSSHPMGC